MQHLWCILSKWDYLVPGRKWLINTVWKYTPSPLVYFFLNRTFLCEVISIWNSSFEKYKSKNHQNYHIMSWNLVLLHIPPTGIFDVRPQCMFMFRIQNGRVLHVTSTWNLLIKSSLIIVIHSSSDSSLMFTVFFQTYQGSQFCKNLKIKKKSPLQLFLAVCFTHNPQAPHFNRTCHI